jgi:phage tail sheath gpL-like
MEKVVIVGTGCAGLTAAIYAGRASLAALPQKPALRILSLTGPTAPNVSIRLLQSRRTGDDLVLDLELLRSDESRGIASIPLTTALDDYRTQVVHLESADQPEYEIAAAFAALRCKIVNRNQTLDYLELPGITAPFAEDKWPTRADEQAALEGGVVPLRPMRNGTVVVVRNVVSRKTTPAFRDAEPMEISDYIDEDLISNAMRKFKGQALKVSSPAGTPNVLTPDRFLVFLHERMRIWDTVLDYTQGAETDIKAKRTVAEQNAQDTCRLDVGYPFRPVFGAHVIAIRKDFTTPDIV